MSIELTNQTSLEELLMTLKTYKRQNDKLTESLRSGHQTQAKILLQQSESLAKKLQRMLHKYEESYINPETAKKVMLIKRQFATQRTRIKDQHLRAQEEKSQPIHNEQRQIQEEDDGFDYQVEHRLAREKGESLNKVTSNIHKIHEVMNSTREITFKQGEDLDLIGDDLQRTKDNLSSANQQLQEANKYSKEHSRSCLWMVLLGIVAACLILILVLLVCSRLSDHKYSIVIIKQGAKSEKRLKNAEQV